MIIKQRAIPHKKALQVNVVFTSLICVLAAFLALHAGEITSLAQSGATQVEQFIGPLPIENGVSINGLGGCRDDRIFPIFDNQKLGYIDGKGKVLVWPKFEAASGNFSEGLAIVYEHGHVSFVDETPAVVIRTNASQAKDFSEGLAAVKIDGLWGYIDRAGKLVIPPKFTSVMPFHEGIADTESEDMTWKAIDRQGHILFEPPEDGHNRYFGWLSYGLAPYIGGGGWGFIGTNGRWAIAPHFDWVEDFKEGVAPVRIGAKWGYIEATGHFVVDPIYDAVGPFSEERAAVRIGAKWGYVDTNGRSITALTYEAAGLFSEDLAAVRLANQKGESRFGFINKAGELVIAPSFESVGAFCHGLVPVRVGRKWGYADRQGRVVVSPRFEGAGNFWGDLAPVTLQLPGAWLNDAYTNKKGKMVWRGHDSMIEVD
jgi:hypothetical protein